MKINFINLTCGLVHLPDIPDPHFVRIQSTWCEQKEWGWLLKDLDYDFLMHLATGYDVQVWDGSHRTTSRAIWQGIPWIRYALNRRWFGHKPMFVRLTGRGNTQNVAAYFENEYDGICEFMSAAKVIFRKIDYIGKFAVGPFVNLSGFSKYTSLDGLPVGVWRDIIEQVQMKGV